MPVETAKPESTPLKDFLLLMHSDTRRAETPSDWSAYFTKLRALGRFEGGSAIGGGVCMNDSNSAGPLHERLTGYIRVLAIDLEDAKSLVAGNPVYEAGGTVEIRELPRT